MFRRDRHRFSAARRARPTGLPVALCLAAVLILCLPVPPAGAAEKYRKTVESYTVPDVTLIDQDGKEVHLLSLLKAERPLLLDFIYATCTTICPVLSAGYSNFQRKMGSDITLVSVSIDPEHDHPEIMKEYLERYDAQPGWLFLTGSRKDIDAVMNAFDAYVPNKMSHYPLTIIWNPTEKNWIRLYGLMGTSDLIKEYDLIAQH